LFYINTGVKLKLKHDINVYTEKNVKHIYNKFLFKCKIINKHINSLILFKFYFYIKSMYIVINLFLDKYKFNMDNLLYIKNLLNNVYNNNIEFNIINLRYLNLDGNILAVCIAKKLKNRNIRVLRLIRMALKLSKKPYIHEYYTYYLNNDINNLLVKKGFNLFLKEMPLNLNIVQKPYIYINRVILYYLNNKIISGLKIEGTGRLTKRLTASRSINKITYKGSLKNNKSSIKGLSSIMLKGYVKSNLQYVNINSYNAIGAYGIKS